MEKSNTNYEIIQEMTQLLDKTAVESFAPIITDSSTEEQDLEAFLINLKAINARYDKNDALVQVKALMEKYNIQIDELLDKFQIHV